VKQYAERRETLFEHAREIQQEYGLTSFATVESELAARVADQAWMTGDGPKAILVEVADKPMNLPVALAHHEVGPAPRLARHLVAACRNVLAVVRWGGPA